MQNKAMIDEILMTGNSTMLDHITTTPGKELITSVESRQPLIDSVISTPSTLPVAAAVISFSVFGVFLLLLLIFIIWYCKCRKTQTGKSVTRGVMVGGVRDSSCFSSHSDFSLSKNLFCHSFIYLFIHSFGIQESELTELLLNRDCHCTGFCCLKNFQKGTIGVKLVLSSHNLLFRNLQLFGRKLQFSAPNIFGI